MPRMNPEAKAKVVAALRSGEYKQGKAALRNKDCFCVWGVICDVSGMGQWSLEPDFIGDIHYGGFDLTPPPEVTDWLGRGNDGAIVYINGISDDIMRHNDVYEIPFDVLAQAIEEQL